MRQVLSKPSESNAYFLRLSHMLNWQTQRLIKWQVALTSIRPRCLPKMRCSSGWRCYQLPVDEGTMQVAFNGMSPSLPIR